MEKQIVECFKALGDPIRFKIYSQLRHGSVCACDFIEVLDLEIAQPTLSFHLKKLNQCGLIDVKKDGIWKFYSINQEVDKLMKDFWDNSNKVLF